MSRLSVAAPITVRPPGANGPSLTNNTGRVSLTLSEVDVSVASITGVAQQHTAQEVSIATARQHTVPECYGAAHPPANSIQISSSRGVHKSLSSTLPQRSATQKHGIGAQLTEQRLDSQINNDLVLALQKERAAMSKAIEDLTSRLDAHHELLCAHVAPTRDEFQAFVHCEEERNLKIEMRLEAVQHQVLEHMRTTAMEQLRMLVEEQVQYVFEATAAARPSMQHVQALVSDGVQNEVPSRVRTELKVLADELAQELQNLAQQISEEIDSRAKSDCELHARIGRELASVRRGTEEMRMSLEEKNALDTQARVEEAAELRAIVESLWHKQMPTSDAGQGHHYFKYTDGRGEDFKECIGDMQDINTLFEMVQEAVGANVMLRKDLYEDKHERGIQLTQFKLEMMQMLQRLQLVEHAPSAEHIDLPDLQQYPIAEQRGPHGTPQRVGHITDREMMNGVSV